MAKSTFIRPTQEEVATFIGKKFGRLTILKQLPKFNSFEMVQCECQCGKIISARMERLRRGATSSCGCARGSHNLSRHPLYFVHRAMLSRCNNVNDERYKDYGGRGITVCAEWNDFLNFYGWAIQNGWMPGLFIDRIENDFGYYPLNCRFITPAESALNRRPNRSIEYKGNKMSLHDLSMKSGIDHRLLYKRIFVYNWPIEKAISRKSQRSIS